MAVSCTVSVTVRFPWLSMVPRPVLRILTWLHELTMAPVVVSAIDSVRAESAVAGIGLPFASTNWHVYCGVVLAAIGWFVPPISDALVTPLIRQDPPGRMIA